MVSYKRAQAGLDFLMTYGWALLIIVLIVGALFALGIFNIGSFMGSRSSGFTQLKPVGWRLAPNGSFTIQFSNNAATDVNITNINATLKTQTITFNTPTSISNGKQSGTITIGTFSNAPSQGGSYAIQVQIQYTDANTGFSYTDSGTITGEVT